MLVNIIRNKHRSHHQLKRYILLVKKIRLLFKSWYHVPRFVFNFLSYRSLSSEEKISWLDVYPQLRDRTPSTLYDAHYFYQDIWAFRHIIRSRANYHIDIGSRVILVGILSAITEVVFLDIRPLNVRLPNLTSLSGNILSLPFADRSIISLSCLHVVEHIGLGRYGDEFDPEGTQKAADELIRVLKPGGSLYLSVPIGISRVCFNAHRVHSPHQVLTYFHNLYLDQFSIISDSGEYIEDANPDDYKYANYACGLFHFKQDNALGKTR